MIAINGKTVSEMVRDISSQSPDTVFYIGSQSGFFFIGTGETYEADIEKLSDKILKSFKAGIIKANQNITECLKPITIKQDKGDSETLTQYADRLERISKLLKDSQHMKEKLTLAIEKWVPIQNRIPIEVFKSDERHDPNGIKIIMKGIEAGKCWFQHEYDDTRKRGKKNG